MVRRNAAAALLALLLGAVEMPTPANAGGSLSVTISPRGDSARAIRDGLRIYSWTRSLRNRARVDQRGSGNGASISQSGSGNSAEIFQRGRGHSGTIEQYGNNNAFGIFQFGRRTSSAVRQTGDGNVGLVLQGGW